MFTLVIGGAASGKSQYAEGLILAAGPMPRVYIATMEPSDEECRARIRRHRALRARKGFETAECYTGLAGLRLPGGGAVLLECMGNLVANELYSPAGAAAGTNKTADTVPLAEYTAADKAAIVQEGLEAAAVKSAILRGIDMLRLRCRELVVVSNEVFSGGRDYEEGTLRYLRVLADVNRALAERADRVAEVVCGQAVYYKGGEQA